jgi:colanic acid/amylovoran biosynthesis glycosyltransferase
LKESINIALILASKPSISEVFINEKIIGLRNSGVIKVDCFYDNYLIGFGKFNLIIYFLKSFIAFKRFWKFYCELSNLSVKTRLAQIIINLPLLTSLRRYEFVHYSFANLICKRAHLGKVIGAKTSLSLRGYDITYFPLNHPGCFIDQWQYVDKIQYNSIDLYNWALKWGANPNTPACYISAAVNDSFVAIDRTHQKKNSLSIISIGRLHWKKGIDFALLALYHLKNKGIPFYYKIIGSGPEKEKLSFMIERLGLRDQVEITDFIEHSLIPQFLDKADILLVPSLQEGSSNIALEAQARGCYCIGFDSEGMSDVISHGITGFVVGIGEWINLADAIENYYYLDIQDRNSKSKFAIERIKNNFTRSNQISKWVDFYIKASC